MHESLSFSNRHEMMTRHLESEVSGIIEVDSKSCTGSTRYCRQSGTTEQAVRIKLALSVCKLYFPRGCSSAQVEFCQSLEVPVTFRWVLISTDRFDGSAPCDELLQVSEK